MIHALKGKTVLITGGSRGIGKAIAVAFAKAGADVAVNYVSNEKEAKDTKNIIEKEKVRCEIYRFDVSDFAAGKEAAERIIKDFSRVDILVNNAGITRDGLIISMSETDFDSVIDTNLKGAFNMIKHFSPHFIRNKSGAIINVASVVGLMGGAGQANYSAAKAGLIGLTKSVAKELSSRGITCNAIAPGFIETDMTAALNSDTKDKYINMIPLRRAGSADDVASLVLFLASASYITGEVVKIDGGLYI